jgi:ABC-type transporter Mla MlaB component
MQLMIESELAQFELPPAVQQRLQTLLDRQDQGIDLTSSEREEAEGLVELAEFLALLKVRSQRLPN